MGCGAATSARSRPRWKYHLQGCGGAALATSPRIGAGVKIVCGDSRILSILVYLEQPELFRGGGMMYDKQKLLSALSGVYKSDRFKRYSAVCKDFIKYLEETEKKELNTMVYDSLTCQYTEEIHPYIHRYMPVYMTGVYWRFSRLQEWYNEHNTPVYLMTLTTSGRDKCIKTAFDVLRDGWTKLSAVLRKMRKKNGTIEYVYVYEPHLGKHGRGLNLGYPHIHVILFGMLSDADIERIKRLWSEKYGIGNMAHGCSIEEVKKHNDIQYLRAYLIKYLQKSFDISNITPAHLVYLAVLWSYYDREKWKQKKVTKKEEGGYKIESTGGGCFRMWGASNGLTRIMKFTTDNINGEKQYYNYLRTENADYTNILERLSVQAFKCRENKD